MKRVSWQELYLNDINIGSVSDLYQMYELIKYVESFEFDGKVYPFNSYTIQDRNKFLNNLAQVTINVPSTSWLSVQKDSQGLQYLPL